MKITVVWFMQLLLHGLACTLIPIEKFKNANGPPHGFTRLTTVSKPTEATRLFWRTPDDSPAILYTSILMAGNIHFYNEQQGIKYCLRDPASNLWTDVEKLAPQTNIWLHSTIDSIELYVQKK
ncbi:hypothetical protein PGT21_036064 [Puccinia graminis f. sp. tritici]|uniref:Uncharacterized protein n=1 Tax=Puccinia graminis f. sp. tritici TaxID=56615 RepID=A0A5B0MHU4_PUCGR|nr:hypothetical protein PGTUg99_037299 [Puccinia graminis f. sp. tritici]KAA1091594.1 hypothetical protein PGT21_036064 [Puccinia graminis f. sp. tritici]